MKKLICTLLLSAVAIFGAIADSAFGGLAKTLNSFDASKAEAIEGKLPDGRDIFPILWKYVYDEPTLPEKTLAFSAKFNSYNLFKNQYVITQQVTYKFGFSLQMQESKFLVVQDGQKFTVATTSMKTYTVDKNGKKTNDGIDANKKSMNQNSKNIAEDFAKTASSLSTDEYTKWSDSSYSNLFVQQSVWKDAGNKLKAKKWYAAHPIEGKKISVHCGFADIDESKEKGFAYKLNCVTNSDKPILITLYSNNDSYLDLKSNQNFNFTGTVKKVNYADSDFDLDYCIKSVVFED